MDDFERRVLKKRKLTIEQHVKVDGEFLSALRRGGVINDDGIANVQVCNNINLLRIFL